LKVNLPLARQDRLIIKELDDELLIYDLDTAKAHCLNQTAALVWKHCNGKRTVAQLRELMQQESGSLLPEEVVWLALDQLESFHLLEGVPGRPAYLKGMKRRELVRHFGVVALGLPLIFSIVAPTAQAQGSGCKNQPCTIDAECCPAHPNCEPGPMKCK
jgi:hypothetical protein